MSSYEQRKILVVGLGVSGQSAVRLLRERGAEVVAIDAAETPALREAADRLIAAGARVYLGCRELKESSYELAVVSPGIPSDFPCLQQLKALGVPVWQLLGGKHRDHIPLFAHTAAPMGPKLIEDLQLLVEQGWNAIRTWIDDPDAK